MQKIYHPAIGVQSYGLGPLLGSDFEGTLQSLKEMGFDLIEPLIVFQEKQGKLPRNLWSFELLEKALPILKECGLAMHSAHVGAGIGPFRLPARTVAEGIRRLTERTDIRLFVFSGMFTGDRGARRWAAYLKELSEMLDGTEARVVYHNHNMELTPVFSGGRFHCPLDTFFELAGSKVCLQMDFGWAAFAGDEEEIFERYRDRIVSLHCKDFAPGICRSGKNMRKLPDAAFTAIGAGEVKTGRLVARYLSLPDVGGDIIIDQDKTAGDRVADLKEGLANIRRAIAEPETIPEKPEKAGVTVDRSRLSLMTFSLAKDRFARKLTIRDTLQLAADAGVPCVDLLTVSEKEIPDYRTAMAQTGVKVLCKIANISFLAGERNCLEAIRKEMGIAQALDAEMLMIVPYLLPTELKRAERMGKEQLRKILVERFSLAVPEGKQRGLTVCFETTPHDEFALSSAEDCRAVLEQVPGLGLVFDTANMLPAGEDPLSYYELLKDQIVHVHLKDVALTKSSRTMWGEFTADGEKMNCCLWGEGVVPIDEIVERMIRDGYRGRFAIEYAHPGGVQSLPTHRAQLEAQLDRTGLYPRQGTGLSNW